MTTVVIMMILLSVKEANELNRKKMVAVLYASWAVAAVREPSSQLPFFTS